MITFFFFFRPCVGIKVVKHERSALTLVALSVNDNVVLFYYIYVTSHSNATGLQGISEYILAVFYQNKYMISLASDWSILPNCVLKWCQNVRLHKLSCGKGNQICVVMYLLVV